MATATHAADARTSATPRKWVHVSKSESVPSTADSASASAVPDVMSPRMRKAVGDQRMRVKRAREVEMLVCKFPVVEEHMRRCIASDRDSDYDEFVDAAAEEYAAAAERYAAAVPQQYAQRMQWLNSSREAALRRTRGREMLVMRMDRELYELSLTAQKDLAKLKGEAVDEENTMIAPQDHDLALLSEGEAWERRGGVMQQRARLREQYNSQRKFRERRWEVATRAERLLWQERIEEYDQRASWFAWVRVLEAEEERCRGQGPAWRRGWWALELDGATDTSLAGIRGEEARSRLRVESFLTGVRDAAAAGEELFRVRTEEMRRVWRWMLQERNGIERKAFKDSQSESRRAIVVEECSLQTRKEWLWHILNCEGQLREVWAEGADRGLYEYARQRTEERCLLWRWAGVRWIELKAVRSAWALSACGVEEQEGRDVCGCEEEGASGRLAVSMWHDHRRVRRLEVELSELPPREAVDARWGFDHSVLHSEVSGRAGIDFTRWSDLQFFERNFWRMYFWLQRKSVQDDAEHALSYVAEEEDRELAAGREWLHRGLAELERWYGVRRLQRRAVEVEEEFVRCEPEADELLWRVSAGHDAEYLALWHRFRTGRDRIERLAVGESELVARWSLSAEHEHVSLALTEHVQWGAVNESFLNGLHVIERAAVEDTESVLRWQLEAEGVARLGVAGGEWWSWRVLMLAEIAERHRIERWALECWENAERVVDAAEPLARLVVELFGEEQVRRLEWWRFAEERHRIQRADLCRLEELLRWQLSDEGRSRSLLDTRMFCEKMALFDAFISEKFAILRAQLVAQERLHRWQHEREGEGRRVLELTEVQSRSLQSALFRQRKHFIERAAFEDCEGVVRWQLAEEGLLRLSVSFAWWMGWALSALDFFVKKHAIEREAFAEVEMVLRWQLSQESRGRFTFEMERWHGRAWLAWQHLTIRKAIERLLLERAESRARLCEEEDVGRGQVSMLRYGDWGGLGAQFLHGRHWIEVWHLEREEQRARVVREGVVGRMNGTLQELRARGYHEACFMESKHAIERRLFEEQEDAARLRCDVAEDQPRTCLEESFRRGEMGVSLTLGRHSIERKEMQHAEELMRWQYSLEEQQREMSDMDWAWAWLVIFHEFWSEKRWRRRKQMGEREGEMRLQVDERATRGTLRGTDMQARAAMIIRARLERVALERWLLEKEELERRGKQQGRLLQKWSQFFEAVRYTLGYYGFREGMKRIEQEVVIEGAVNDMESVVSAEALAWRAMQNLFRVAVRVDGEEATARLYVWERENRGFLNTILAVHASHLRRAMRRHRDAILSAEREENEHYARWRLKGAARVEVIAMMAGKDLSGLALTTAAAVAAAPKSGILRLLRAAPSPVVPVSTELKGLRLLRRAVLGNVGSNRAPPPEVLPARIRGSPHLAARDRQPRPSSALPDTEVDLVPVKLYCTVGQKTVECTERAEVTPPVAVFFVNESDRAVPHDAHLELRVASGVGELRYKRITKRSAVHEIEGLTVSEAGLFEIAVCATLSNGGSLFTRFRLKAWDAQPAGVTNATWSLFGALRHRIVAYGGRIDPAAMELLRLLRANKGFAELAAALGHRHQWLLAGPDAGARPSKRPAQQAEAPAAGYRVRAERTQQPTPQQHRRGPLPPLGPRGKALVDPSTGRKVGRGVRLVSTQRIRSAGRAPASPRRAPVQASPRGGRQALPPLPHSPRRQRPSPRSAHHAPIYGQRQAWSPTGMPTQLPPLTDSHRSSPRSAPTPSARPHRSPKRRR